MVRGPGSLCARAVAVALVAVAALVPSGTRAAAATGLPAGTVVLPRGSGFLLIDAETGAEQSVAVSPAVGVTGHVTWSPDGTRVALSRFGKRPGERVGGSDILVVAASGGQAVPVAEHDLDGALLEAPVWAPDGSGLFYDYLPPNGSSLDHRVEFMPLDGSGRRIVVNQASWPAISPDGRRLAFVRPSPFTGYLDELVVMALDGSGEQVLVPAGQLVQIICPRFSPDGRQIAFIGSVTRGDDLDSNRGPDELVAFRPSLHGPPGDLWLVGLDGTPAWQRTGFSEDDPTLAWSPDGTSVLILAGGGMYLVDVVGWIPSSRVGPGGFGGLDWRRPLAPTSWPVP